MGVCECVLVRLRGLSGELCVVAGNESRPRGAWIRAGVPQLKALKVFLSSFCLQAWSSADKTVSLLALFS